MTEADNKKRTYMSRKNYEGKVFMLVVVIVVLMIPTLVLIAIKDYDFWLVPSIFAIPIIIAFLAPTIDKILMKKKLKKGVLKHWQQLLTTTVNGIWAAPVLISLGMLPIAL